MCSILRYKPGQRYKRHVDNLLLASRFQEVANNIPTRDVSIIGYLNDDFEGGGNLVRSPKPQNQTPGRQRDRLSLLLHPPSPIFTGDSRTQIRLHQLAFLLIEETGFLGENWLLER